MKRRFSQSFYSVHCAHYLPLPTFRYMTVMLIRPHILLSCFLLLAISSALRAEVAKGGIIDTHFHAMACTPHGLDTARSWMDGNDVTHIIVACSRTMPSTPA